MKIAVLTLTRDRLDYTKTCFKALRQNAGCDYDHLILDQGSTDGTMEWLIEDYGQVQPGCVLHREDNNVGIHVGMNILLRKMEEEDDYDLLVKVDNDCRVLTPGTLKAVAEHVLADPRTPRVVSPLILGLRNRPGIFQEIESRGDRIGLTRALGGIFFAIPPVFIKEGFRFDEAAPVWGGDDERLSSMVQERGGRLGYLLDFEAEHYETTNGQVARYPGYFQRRVSEGGPPK